MAAASAADLALILAARGTNVAMTYHSSRAVIERKIEDAGSRAMAWPSRPNLARPAAADAAVSQVVDRFGQLDALVVWRRSIGCTSDHPGAHDFGGRIVAAGGHIMARGVCQDHAYPARRPRNQGQDRDSEQLGNGTSLQGLLALSCSQGALRRWPQRPASSPRISPSALIQPAMIDPPDCESEQRAVLEQIFLAPGSGHPPTLTD